MVLVVGPSWVDDRPPAALRATSAAVEAAARGGRVRWVDPLEEGWLADGDGMIGTDGVHPTDLGHQELADRFDDLVRPLLR